MHYLKKLFPQSLKNLYHLAQAILANVIYGFPSRKIKIIGITGTNGKTTTSQMVTKILEKSGKAVAMASTINFKIGEKEWVNTTKYTTTSPFSVQKFIKKAVESGCTHLVLETSSHSLDQYRVWGVKYDTALITNVTREHLDYHKTMERYREAKKKLFKIVEKNKGTIVVNLDMENPEEYLEVDVDMKYGYCTEMRSVNEKCKIVRAEKIQLGIDGSSYQIQNTEYRINLPGLFNIENALAATCVGMSEDIDPETISMALEEIKYVPGRFELVKNDKCITIIIDYAVTPDSLDKLYELIGTVCKNSIGLKGNRKVIAVFGSCGERDRGKRPIMGEIVSKNADIVIITNEDPYHEDPQRIIDEVSAGVKDKIEGENFFKITDRRAAIKKALQFAADGDVVVVTGKGAEETMAIGDARIPWNERKIIEEILGEI